MLSTYQKELIESFYEFTAFALATGLKSPLIAFAWDDFREFTWDLMKQEERCQNQKLATLLGIRAKDKNH